MPKPDEAQLEEIDTVIKGTEAELKATQEYYPNSLPLERGEKREKDEIGPWNQRGWPESPPSGGLVITEREYKMIHDCRRYEAGFKSGLPGHNTMILVAKLSEHLENLYGISPNDGPYVINQ